ncbi:MAG: hypothetical protein ACYTBJ_25005, partial [Planctomycetota bacterium]
MSLDDNQIDIGLNVEPDPQLAQKIQKATDTINGELGKIAQAEHFDELVQDAIKFAKETDDATAAVKRLVTELDKAGASADEIELAGQQFAAGTAPTAPGAAAGGPDIGQAGAVSGFAGAAAGLAGAGPAGSALGLLGQSLGTLGPAGVAATAATVGLGVAVNLLKTAAQSAADEINRQAEIEDMLIELEITGNATLAQERLESLKQELQLAEARSAARIATLEDEEDELDKATSGAMGVFQDAFIVAILGVLAPIAPLLALAGVNVDDLKDKIVDFGASAGLIEGDLQASRENAEGASEEVAGLNEEIAALEEGLSEGRFGEAADETEELGEATTAATRAIKRETAAQRAGTETRSKAVSSIFRVSKAQKEANDEMLKIATDFHNKQ